jgi:death-on-curing protein
MNEWVWLDERDALTIHDVQLSEHGGLPGVRDKGALASALARPLNLAAYGTPDVAALAAAYVFGLARNHPFSDANKRTAFVVMETFLELNGVEFTANDEDCVLTMLRIAAGEIGEVAIADWIRRNSRPK